MKFKIKKLLCFTFALLMLLSAIPAAAVGGSARSSSYPDVQFPTVDYTDLGDAYAVRRAQPGTHQEMTIPDTHSGKPVTTLATGCLCTSYDLIDYGNFNDGTPSYGYYYYPCTYYLPASITTVENEIVAGGNDITLVFQGTAPSFADNAFYNVSKVTVRYPSATSPCGVSGWTEVAGNSYGADKITWSDYTLDHNFQDGTCRVCGKSEDQKECDHNYFGSTICNNCGEPCPHSSYILSWQVQPTCTGEGTSLYHCSTCGDPKTVTVPATGHDYYNGYCNTCGRTCKEHNFRVEFFSPPMSDLGFDGTMRRVCTVCGYTELVQVPYDEHNFGEPLTYSPTCTQDGHRDYACIDCDYVISVVLHATGHDYVSGVCVSCGKVCSHNYENGTCTICDKACAHIFRAESPISCTEGGEVMHVCQVCGITQLLYIPPNSHNYKNSVCIYCGEAEPNCAQLTGTMLLPCENVKVWLFVSGEDTPAYTAQISGEQYCFTGVTPGGYTLKVSCDGGVPREYPVTLTPGENTQDVTLSRPGDVDGDRDLTVVDVSMVYAHVRGTQTLEGYSLQCADLNGDGQVDIVDTAIAYSMTRE